MYSAPVDGAPQFANGLPPQSMGMQPQQQQQQQQQPQMMQAMPQQGQYASFIQSSQQMNAVPGIPVLNGVPMPFFPPTPGVVPAPNQVPAGSQLMNGVYPSNMVQPTTANMAFTAAGMTQSPGVNAGALPMGPNALASPLANYPFGGASFIELDSIPLHLPLHPHEKLPSNDRPLHKADKADKASELSSSVASAERVPLDDAAAERLLGEEFGAAALLQLEEELVSSPDAIHPYVDSLGRHGSDSDAPFSSFHSSLSPQHFEPFPLLSN